MKNENAKKSFNWDYASVLTLYLLAGIFLYNSMSIKQTSSKLFPIIISIFAILFATLLLIKAIITPPGKREVYDFGNAKQAIFITVSLFAYIVGMIYLGFYLATPLYLYISMWLLGQRKQKILILISILTPLFVYLVFDLLLQLQIPLGMLILKLLGRI